LVIGLAGGGILSATAPIALLPVSLSLKLEARSPKVGQSVPLRIALRDAEGAEVAAAADLTVTISIEQTETPLTAVVLKGQASVTMSITFPRAGPIRVTASAPALRGSSIVAAVLADVAPVAVSLPAQASSAQEMARVRSAVLQPTIADFETVRPTPTITRGGTATTMSKSGTARGAETMAGRPPLAGRGVLTPPVTASPQPAPPSAPVVNPPVVPPVVITQDVPGIARSGLQLDIYLEPEPVFPTSDAWSANVRLFLRGTNDGPLTPAQTDVVVELVTDRGSVSPARVVIPAGQVSTDPDAPIVLTASQAGTVVLRALSGIGVRDRLVKLESPLPVALALSVSPSTLSSNGREEGRVSVWLVDADGIPTSNLESDVQVQLDFERVRLKDAIVTIPKGQISGTTTLVGLNTGEGTVTARAVGFREASISLQLVFPWLAILLAAGGGATGSLMARTGKSVHVIVRIVVTGIVTGVLAYLLASFDVLSAIPGLPDVFAKVPFGAPAGSLVIGFLAGYLGRPMLDLVVGKKKAAKR
jgi:hypothetical protein